MEISAVSEPFFTHGQRVEFQSKGDTRVWFRCTYIRRIDEVYSEVTDSSGKPPRPVETARLRRSNSPPLSFGNDAA